MSKASSGIAEISNLYQVKDTEEVLSKMNESINWQIISATTGGLSNKMQTFSIQDFIPKKSCNILLVLGK